MRIKLIRRISVQSYPIAFRREKEYIQRNERLSVNSTAIHELISLTGENSHAEYPLLRVGYSPSSRYPATDFTDWIAKRLVDNDIDSLIHLLTQLTRANPGWGISTDYWRSVAEILTQVNLEDSITCGDPKAIIELRSALFPYSLHGSLNGFMLLSSHAGYLARALSPYHFSIPDLPTKVELVNSFIRKMRRKTKGRTYAWTNLSIVDSDKIEKILKAAPPSPELQSILRELSIGSRLMFLGTVEDGPGQGGWNVRPYGVDERKSTEELVEIGLGRFVHDTEVVLSTYRIEELISSLDSYEIKRGWRKKHIIKFIMQHAPNVATMLCRDRVTFEASEKWIPMATNLIGWIENIRLPITIALVAAFSGENTSYSFQVNINARGQ